jgi:N-acetylglutamate synthase-like GNAT family acetyltransferase
MSSADNTSAEVAEVAIVIQPATAGDQAAITALVRSERLNPNGIRWEHFLVAKDGARLIGAAQIRCHRDGSRELGSLVVAPDNRRAGLAGRLISALLSAQNGPVYMVTGRAHAAHFARWGFEPVRPSGAPKCVLRNYCLGQIAGGVHAWITWRPVNRLVVLRRDGFREP